MDFLFELKSFLKPDNTAIRQRQLRINFVTYFICEANTDLAKLLELKGKLCN